MEAVLFIGIQATGKSTFYRERFFHTHVRISLDLLRTRHRERSLLELCLRTQQPFVVDNTNPTVAERAVYLNAARRAGFTTVGYYFQSVVADALARNAAREGRQRIPDRGVYGCAGRLERPALDEGFDQLWYVSIDPGGGFWVREWEPDAPPGA